MEGGHDVDTVSRRLRGAAVARGSSSGAESANVVRATGAAAGDATAGAPEGLSRKQRNRLARAERRKAHKRLKQNEREKAGAGRRAQTKAHPTVLLRVGDGGAAVATGDDGVERAAADGRGRRTPALEIEHVRRVYDAIALQWHGTRYKAWPRVAAFVAEQRAGALIGDFGCGNGKNLVGTERPLLGVGCDSSVELCKIAAGRGVEIAAADATALPFRSCVFDGGLCIAVLHHISSPPRREALVRECMRTLRVGAHALFYAWALEQQRPAASGGGASATRGGSGGGGADAVSGHRFPAQDVLVPFHQTAAAGGSAAGAAELEHAVWDPAKRALVYQRYCHVYAAGELRALFAPLAPWVRVVDVYWDCGNWALRAEKVAQCQSL